MSVNLNLGRLSEGAGPARGSITSYGFSDMRRRFRAVTPRNRHGGARDGARDCEDRWIEDREALEEGGEDRGSQGTLGDKDEDRGRWRTKRGEREEVEDGDMG